jgi:hypothetical protein
MKKLVAIVVLGAALVGAPVGPAQASGVADAALALGAFAVFSQLFWSPLWARPWYEPAYVTPGPIIYSSPAYSAPAQYYAPPAAPAIQREVVYAQGRYLLFGDGVRTAYQWVWVPNPPPPGSAPQ